MKNVKCPVYDFSCLYFKAGMCTMPEQDGTHPLKECDDYGFAIENFGSNSVGKIKVKLI